MTSELDELRKFGLAEFRRAEYVKDEKNNRVGIVTDVHVDIVTKASSFRFSVLSRVLVVINLSNYHSQSFDRYNFILNKLSVANSLLNVPICDPKAAAIWLFSPPGYGRL